MNFCNLHRRFCFEGHQLYFSFCDADNMDVPELNIFGDTEEAKAFLEDDGNQERVHGFVMSNYINKGVSK